MRGTKTRIAPATPMEVCEVCRGVRPADELDSTIRDVGERFGVAGNLFFIVLHCKDHRECREQAEARAEAFAAGKLATVEWTTPQPAAPESRS